MSISNFAVAVTASKPEKVTRAPKTPRPWDVYKVFACENGATLDENGYPEGDAALLNKARECAIEGYFGAVDSVAELHGLLLGLGQMVAHAPKNADGYIDGLRGWRKPWKSMFSMALSGLLPQDGDLGLLLTWADVLWASKPELRAMVLAVQAECTDVNGAEAIAHYEADLAAERAKYRSEHTRKAGR